MRRKYSFRSKPSKKFIISNDCYLLYKILIQKKDFTKTLCLLRHLKDNRQTNGVNDFRMFDFGSINEISIKENNFRLFPYEIVSIEENCFDFFQNLMSLKLNSCKMNKIESATFKSLSNLKKLDLGQNDISQIKASEFKGLENLEELHLDRNKLTKIQSNSFQHLKK